MRGTCPGGPLNRRTLASGCAFAPPLSATLRDAASAQAPLDFQRSLSMAHAPLVRQPVFGTTGTLVGYEIRYSDGCGGEGTFVQSVLSGTFDLVRGRQPAFVACTREHLLADARHMVDPTSAVLLLPPTLEPDAEVTAAIAEYCQNGGAIALDGITTVPGVSEILLPHAAWVRLASELRDLSTLERVIARLKEAQRTVRVLMHRIDDSAQYEVALQLGVDGFQGAFFSSPEPIPTSDLPKSTISAMRLMGLARDPNVHDKKLEELIAIDPVLTFQLLSLVNSAAVGMRGVSSIGQALRLIGRTTFQRWLAVAVAASRKSKTGVDQELVRHAVERGRLLEQLQGQSRDGGTLFLVGLFSLLDGVFRMSLPDILDRVSLSDDATAALLDRAGPYADALAFAESYELGLFEHAGELAREMGVDPNRVGDMYTNALSWTNEALSAVLDAQPATR
jgi:EAL and modified HD-GYP domain-containing signal transduction protein